MRVGVDGDPSLRNPKVVSPPAFSEPFQLSLRTVTDEPPPLSSPFQTCVIRWPLASVQLTVQPLMPEVPARTVTSPWKPPGQELTVW